MKPVDELDRMAWARLRQRIDHQTPGNGKSNEHLWELVFDPKANLIYVEHSWKQRSGRQQVVQRRLDINEYLQCNRGGAKRLRDMLVSLFWQ
jgi:hypothetical protein